MADPKIKYDIEAAVKGDADAEQLAKALRDVGDALDGDLKTSATEAAQALDALGAKQRALDTFARLKREVQELSTELDRSVGAVDRLGNELQESAAKTQAAAAAEKTAADAVQTLQTSLQAKRDALRTTREEATRATKQTTEYRTTVDGLKASIKAAATDLKQHQTDQRTATRASQEAQNAEAALRKEYDLAVGAAAKLSGSLRAKNTALDQSRQSMRAMGLTTTGVTQQQRSLQTAVEQVRTEVIAMAPAYQQAAAASSQSTQVQAQNQRALREGMTSISTQLQRIQQIATIAVGGGYFGGLIKDVAATSDEFKNLEDRIKIVTGEGAQLASSFEGVTRVALDTNSALTETGDLFMRLTRASQEGGMAVEQAQERALRLTQTINQAMQLSGGSAEAANAALVQLIQGLQSGVLRGEEFNSVMEQAPRLAQALAQGLGVTTGELRQMANQGVLTSETIMKALEGQSDTVAREFGNLRITVGRALQNLSTQWTIYVGESDKGMISSANAAKVIDALAKNLDLLVTSLTSAGKVWAAFKIASLAADFKNWAATTLTATKAVEANTAATTANTVAARANAAAQAQSAAAQAANTAATAASTAARAANAKAWSDIGAFTRAATEAQTAATAANTASTAATVAKTGALGALGKGVAGLTRLLGGPVGLVVTLFLFREELSRAKDATLDWAFSFTEAGKQLKANEKALRDQEQAAKAHADATKAAAEANRLLAARQEEARTSSFDLTKQSNALIAQFDKLKKEGESTAEALGKIGKDFDVSNSEGIRAMSAALNKLLADGKITASEFRSSWAKALDGQDLAKFEVMARNAFAAAGQEAEKLRVQLDKAIASGASEEVIKGLRQRLENAMKAAATEGERVATMMDNVLREAVHRTGLEYDQLQGKIGAASRSAINDVEAIVAGLTKLKAEGVDTGRVLTASLVKAIDTADSQAAIDNLTQRIQTLRGDLGDKITDGLLDQAKKKAEELKDALDAATPGINSVREAMKALGITSDEELKRVAASAKDAYDTVSSSGKASARELQEAFKKAAQAAIDANNGVAPVWVQAAAAMRGFELEADKAGKTTLKLKSATDQAADAHKAAAGAAGQQTTALERLNAEQERAIAAQEKANDLATRNLKLEEAKRTAGVINPVDAVPSFESQEQADAWLAEWKKQYAKRNAGIVSGSSTRTFMWDTTMGEWNGEVSAMKLRNTMKGNGNASESSQTPLEAMRSGQRITIDLRLDGRSYGDVDTDANGAAALQSLMRELERAKRNTGR